MCETGKPQQRYDIRSNTRNRLLAWRKIHLGIMSVPYNQMLICQEWKKYHFENITVQITLLLQYCKI